MEHPGGQPPTPCAPHASYAGMRACARYAGACASRASYTGMRARARCAGAPLRSPSPAASRTVAPPSIGCNCKARGKVSLIAPNHPERVVSVISVVRPRLSWCCCSPFFARHTSTAFRTAAQHVRTHTAPAYASAPSSRPAHVCSQLSSSRRRTWNIAKWLSLNAVPRNASQRRAPFSF